MIVDVLKVFKDRDIYAGLLNVHPKVYAKLEGLGAIDKINICSNINDMYEHIDHQNSETPLLHEGHVNLTGGTKPNGILKMSRGDVNNV